MGKKLERRAAKQAEFDRIVAHEKRLAAFRDGKLSYYEAEEITAQLCAAGDLERRREAEKAAREQKELGARLRAGVI
jgi:hypothetical protein